MVEESYMEMDFIRNRITELRVKKGVSEYQLSYDLGWHKYNLNCVCNAGL